MSPEELLNLARFLAHAPESESFSAEVQWRSSINRAYYAVYARARLLLAEEGIQFIRSDASHEQVRKNFESSRDTLRNSLARSLERLLRLRCRADYEAANPPSAMDAANALLWASQALVQIQTLRRRVSPIS